MPARRIEAGPLLVLAGAVVLLVALFLDWYRPGVSGWEVFELADLLLAVLAVGAAAGALAQLGALTGPDPRALPWCAAAAFVLVIATVLNAPPGAIGRDTGTGLWLAAAAVVVMALGAVLTGTRVRISLDVEGRRRRVSSVDSRHDRAEDSPAAHRRRRAAVAGSAVDEADADADERPAYRMSFDPPDEDEADDLGEPWTDAATEPEPPPRRESDA